MALSIGQYCDEDERRVIRATFIACNQGITQLRDGYEQSLRDERVARQTKASNREIKQRHDNRAALWRRLKVRIVAIKLRRFGTKARNQEFRQAEKETESETGYETEMMKTSDEDDGINAGYKFGESFEFSQRILRYGEANPVILYGEYQDELPLAEPPVLEQPPAPPPV